MLAIARALVQSPKLLLIDEMSMGLAPVAVESLMPVIRRVADDRGASVIMVEQHVQLALEVADRALVMVHGNIVLEGPAEQYRNDVSAVESAYIERSRGSSRPASQLASSSRRNFAIAMRRDPDIGVVPFQCRDVPRTFCAVDDDLREADADPYGRASPARHAEPVPSCESLVICHGAALPARGTTPRSKVRRSQRGRPAGCSP